MILQNIDLKSGKKIFDQLNINPNISYDNQIDELIGDLLYIKFPKHSEVDVGWLPDCDPNGRFIVQVLKNEDWENPIYRKETRSFLKLEEYLQEGIDLAENLANDESFSNSIASDTTDFEYSNFKFDRSLFKQFFSEEHVFVLELGSFYYSVQLEDDFEFTIYILAVDKFIGLKLRHKTNPIFSVGFEEIVSIKLVQSDDYCFLDLYKASLGESENNPLPYLRVFIKPHVDIKALAKN